MKFYSQYNQDKLIYQKYFKDKSSGIFLEIGADDGVDKSNTLFFEETLNWQGICIEPSPYRFKLLSKNRKCICENFALSDSVGEVEFMEIKGWGKALSGIVNTYHEDHTKRIEKELKNSNNQGYEIIKVKTNTLSNILDKNNIKEIDFCSIDVEGSEYDIIKSIDFKKYKFNIIIVENNYNDNSIKELMLKNNFRHEGKLTIDDVYVNKDFIK